MICRVETEQDPAVAIDAFRSGGHLDIRGGFPGAGGLQAAFPGHFDQADSAATGTVELATNDIMYDSFDFDTTTEEGVGFWLTFPEGWDAGTVKFKAHWTAASGSGTVKFDFAGRAYADSDAMDQALGTEQGTTDTLLTANDMHISPATSAMTIGGTPTDGEPVYIQVARDVATDTLGVDAQLLGVVVEFARTLNTTAAW